MWVCKKYRYTYTIYAMWKTFISVFSDRNVKNQKKMWKKAEDSKRIGNKKSESIEIFNTSKKREKEMNTEETEKREKRYQQPQPNLQLQA